MKLINAIIAFIIGLGLWLGLVYIFNYALISENTYLYDLIPSDYMDVYKLFNIMWSAIPFIGGLAILIRTLNKEGIFG